MTHTNAPPRPSRRTARGLPIGVNDYLTCGRMARAMRVAPRTVAKWADAGRLPGTWRVTSRPGYAGDRRIPVTAAVALCRELGCAVPADWLAGWPVVLLVGLARAVAAPEGCRVEAVDDGFDAGRVVEAGGTFAAVVVDAGRLGSDVAAGMLAAMRRHPRLDGVPLAVVAADDDDGSRWVGVADRVLRGPVGAGDVAGVTAGG